MRGYGCCLAMCWPGGRRCELAGLRRRLRLVVVSRGLACVVTLVLCSVILSGLLDWRLRLPGLVRALLLTGSLSAAVYIAYRYLLAPLWGRSDDLSLALRVEVPHRVLQRCLGHAMTAHLLEERGTVAP